MLQFDKTVTVLEERWVEDPWGEGIELKIRRSGDDDYQAYLAGKGSGLLDAARGAVEEVGAEFLVEGSMKAGFRNKKKATKAEEAERRREIEARAKQRVREHVRITVSVEDSSEADDPLEMRRELAKLVKDWRSKKEHFSGVECTPETVYNYLLKPPGDGERHQMFPLYVDSTGAAVDPPELLGDLSDDQRSQLSLAGDRDPDLPLEDDELEALGFFAVPHGGLRVDEAMTVFIREEAEETERRYRRGMEGAAKN